MFEQQPVERAPVERAPVVRAPARPQAPVRYRVWPLVVLTIMAGVGGVLAAMHFSSTSDHDAPAFTMQLPRVAPPPMPAAPVVAPAIVAAPAVEPQPIAPTIVAAPAPTIEPQPTVPTVVPPTEPTQHHRAHAKPKHVVAKHAKLAAPPEHTPAAAPDHAPAATASMGTPPAPTTTRTSRQAADKENPL